MKLHLRRAAIGSLVALGLLLTLECGLRLTVGAPQAPQPLVRARWNMDGPAFLTDGEQVRPGFQGHDGVGPFPRAPAPDVPRVMVFGGSSIRGGSRISAAHEAPGRLSAGLRDSGTPVEVINLGRPALDSSHHLIILQQALAFAPDLVVLYMGHNDLGNAVLEDRYGTVGQSLEVRLRLLLGHLASYSLLRDWMVPSGGSANGLGLLNDPAVNAHQRGARLGTQRNCPPGDSRRALAARDLESNLVAMAAAAQRAGARTVMVTPVSNWVSAGPVGRSCPDLVPPLVPVLGPGEQGGATLTSSQIEAALALDPDCPELLFERGLQRLEQADAGAYRDLRAAMEGDVLPLRATRAMTDAVRSAAEASGARLVDLEATAVAEHGAPPPIWFVDLVHLSAQGHIALAQALEPVVREELAPLQIPNR